MPTLAAALALVALALASCSSRSGEGDRKEALASAGSAGGAPVAPLDPARPLEALQATAGDAAARLGSFAWEGQVSWTVARAGMPPVHAVEKHRLRQLAGGEFELGTDLDPGTGPGSETGKSVVFAGGMTYARSRWAPFRERPTDRGHGARRARDESFRMAGDLAGLFGPALAAQPAGETTVLGRPARRFRLALSGEKPAPRPPPSLPAAGYDDDTKRRVAFLEGRIPVAAEGELVVDAATGVPLSVQLKGAFTEKDDPALRADVELSAAIRSLGAAVAAVHPPRNALADERKPKGVARALEAAGLKKKAGPAGEAEPDEGEPEE